MVGGARALLGLIAAALVACAPEAESPSQADAGASDVGSDGGSPIDVFVPRDESEASETAWLWEQEQEAGLCDAWVPLLDEDFGSICFVPSVNVTETDDATLQDVWTYSALDHGRARFIDGCRTLQADTSSADAFRTWQQRGAEALHRVLRIDAATWADVPLHTRELSTEQREGYTRIALDWLVEPGLRVPAWLLVPDGLDGPAPAVLFIHGHSDGARSAAVGDPPWVNEEHHAGATRLAEAGYVVLAPDVRSFGETGSWAEHQHYAELLHFQGLVAYGVFTADMMRALDVLSARPEVDPERIGVTGLSMGGQITAYLTALDPRVKAAVVQGYLGYQNVSLARRYEDPCQYIPMLDQLMRVPDIGMLSAPTPTAWVAGEFDPIYLPAEAQAAWTEIAAGYAVIGASDAVRLYRHEGGHEWMLEPALEFFGEHL